MLKVKLITRAISENKRTSDVAELKDVAAKFGDGMAKPRVR